MRVSLVQFAACTDQAANLETITRLARDAAASQPAQTAHIAPAAHFTPTARFAPKEPDDAEPHLVVLPEGAMHDISDQSRPLGLVAEPVDGPFVSSLAHLAKRLGATVVAGMLESSDDPDIPYNTLVALSPQGELAASYRKIHLYDSFGYQESERVKAGEGGLAILPLGGLTLGLQTCYDLRFPEMTRALVDAGADTIVVPAAWVRGPLKEDHWATLLRARAIENTAYVLGAGQCGRSYIGCSMVVDPMGTVLAGLGADEGIATALLSPAKIGDARRINPALANRRLTFADPR